MSTAEVWEVPLIQAAQRVAVVTGANRGIGREVVRQLAVDHGFVVVLGSRDRARGEQAARDLDRSGERVRAQQLDVADPASVRAVADHVRQTLGHLDVVVNNAAVDYDTDARGVTADLDRVRRDLDTNLFGAWQMVQAFLPLLRVSAHPRVVNVSSESGSISHMTGGTPAYAASKAAPQRPHPTAGRRAAPRPGAGQRGVPGMDGYGHGSGRTARVGRRSQHRLGRTAA
jgi:NAD(P)-dependent dehydrogenase (short-subunit alcohol dehydrogenase family)